jgi:hypothetical protein
VRGLKILLPEAAARIPGGFLLLLLLTSLITGNNSIVLRAVKGAAPQKREAALLFTDFTEIYQNFGSTTT